jgi:hypothetical protein
MQNNSKAKDPPLANEKVFRIKFNI